MPPLSAVLGVAFAGHGWRCGTLPSSLLPPASPSLGIQLESLDPDARALFGEPLAAGPRLLWFTRGPRLPAACRARLADDGAASAPAACVAALACSTQASWAPVCVRRLPCCLLHARTPIGTNAPGRTGSVRSAVSSARVERGALPLRMLPSQPGRSYSRRILPARFNEVQLAFAFASHPVHCSHYHAHAGGAMLMQHTDSWRKTDGVAGRAGQYNS